jgi:hypothetical protein
LLTDINVRRVFQTLRTDIESIHDGLSVLTLDIKSTFRSPNFPLTMTSCGEDKMSDRQTIVQIGPNPVLARNQEL